MSEAQNPAPSRREPTEQESVTTAAGLAAERAALADRERDRERRLTDARSAARRLDRRPADARL
jgi:hypothetical protein